MRARPPRGASASSSRSTSSRGRTPKSKGSFPRTRPMAVERAAPQADRDLASIAEARALARAARQAQTQLAELSQEQIDAIVTAMAEAVTPHAEALARLAVEETGYGVVADKVQKNLFASRQVYEFIRPMRTVGVINRIEDKKIIEIARAVRRGCRRRPVHQSRRRPPSTRCSSRSRRDARSSSVRIPSAVRCITRTVEIMAEAAAACRRSRRQHRLDEDGDARRHAGADEAPRRRRDSGDRRHGAGARGLQRRQAGVRRRSRQRPVLHRAKRRPPEGRARHHHRQDVRQRRAVLVAELGGRGRVGRRGSPPRVPGAAAPLPERREMDALAAAFVTPQRLPNPALVGKSATFIAEKVGIQVPGDTRVLIAPLAGVGRDYPLSIEKLAPSPLVVRRRGLARRMRALHSDPPVRRHGAHHVDSLEERRGHPSVRPEEAGVPDLRQHADDSRVNRADDRPRSRDDAGLRRLGRQHHVRQHLPASPAQHQAPGVRGASRSGVRARRQGRLPVTYRRPRRHPVSSPRRPAGPSRKGFRRKFWPVGSTGFLPPGGSLEPRLRRASHPVPRPQPRSRPRNSSPRKTSGLP